MAARKIIEIDEELCTGCGDCIPECPEGALQIIDGKARLISDLFCDGLGACVGHCPTGAMQVVEKEAEKYEEAKVMENIIKQGPNVIRAHLEHLMDHGETDMLKVAVKVLEEKGIENPIKAGHVHQHHEGCPGAKTMDFSDKKQDNTESPGKMSSQLRQWPIQLHLISPMAPYFHKKDVILAADCTAFALGDFHNHLKGKSLIIACPKLDQGMDVYEEKIINLIEDADINTLTVMVMQVPCCTGLVMLAKGAVEKCTRKIPIKAVTVSIQGEVMKEEWV